MCITKFATCMIMGVYKSEWLANNKSTLLELGLENLCDDPPTNFNTVVLKNLFDNKLKSCYCKKWNNEISVPVNYTIYFKKSSKWSHT